MSTAGSGDKPSSPTPDKDGRPEEVQIPVRLPRWYEGEIRYANHLAATFTGQEFLLSVAQVRIPITSTKDEFAALVQEGPLESRIVAQFAVPADPFVDAIDRFSELVGRLRDEGMLQDKRKEGQ